MTISTTGTVSTRLARCHAGASFCAPASLKRRLGALRYQTAPYAEIVADLRPVCHLTDRIFIDVGCGKGRVLMVAAELGFTQLIGVEYDRRLAAIARRNLQTMGIGASIVCQNAATFDYPPSRDAVVYMYDPFTADVMQRVIANMARHSARLHLIYTGPFTERPS